ncbi:hypothetical protein LZ30DRAFT_689195 [Colletotrichum cereale]|nr:hypothetical protein LZ30DRAFT_689195 [Colletotrichum cereale]
MPRPGVGYAWRRFCRPKDLLVLLLFAVPINQHRHHPQSVRAEVGYEQPETIQVDENEPYVDIDTHPPKAPLPTTASWEDNTLKQTMSRRYITLRVVLQGSSTGYKDGRTIVRDHDLNYLAFLPSPRRCTTTNPEIRNFISALTVGTR